MGERGEGRKRFSHLCMFFHKNRYSLKLSNVLLAESFIRLLHLAMDLYCCAFAELLIDTSSSSLVLLLMLAFDTMDGDFE